MAEPLNAYSLFPLGDSAMTLDVGNCIDVRHNIRVLAIYDWLSARRFPGMLDIVVAYGSVSVFYDPAVIRENVAGHSAGQWVGNLLERAWGETAAIFADGHAATEASGTSFRPGRIIRVPVCYEGDFAPDLSWVAARQGLSEREVVDLHCAGEYLVYMIGFLPGFPYLGTLDTRLRVPRKTQPMPVKAGGIGIAGQQTGIYSLNSPGGWRIIGRTPMRLFEPWENPPVRLQTGDRVQFYRISPGAFEGFSARPL